MRVQSQMIRFFIGAAALAAVVWTASCGKDVTTPDEQLTNEFTDAPNWVLEGCHVYWGDDQGARLCRVGDARIGGSMSIARTKATSRARTEISRMLETKVRNMLEGYQEQVHDGESEMSPEQFSSTVVSLSKSTLNGTSVQQTWVSRTDQLYMLVALDVESFKSTVRAMDEMPSRLQNFIEARAKKFFIERNEGMEATEGF